MQATTIRLSGESMRRAPFLAVMAVAIVMVTSIAPATAQPGEFYAGKTLRILVGVEAGGTVDTLARVFVGYLRKHIPGNPAIVIQNMPSAAGVGATNFVYEKAAPDGLTILFNSWDPLAQALGDQGMRARYENFEFVGGVGDIRLLYGRSDIVPGGVKTACRHHACRERHPRLRSTTPTSPGSCRTSRLMCSASSTG